MKTYKLEDLTDTYIGKEGTKNREEFENELRLDLLGEAIKHTSITLPPAEIQWLMILPLPDCCDPTD